MLWGITVAAFITVLSLLLIISYYLTSGKRDVSERIDKFVKMQQAVEEHAPSVVPSGELYGWRAWVRHMSKYVESPKWSRMVEHKLIQAGLPLRGSEFLVICFAAAVIGALICVIVSGMLIIALLGGIIGGSLPILILRIKAERRTKKFNDQLGDALILIANSLRTGYSFMQSIEMVSREMLPPISEEFGRVLKEMNLGVVTEDAMNNLAKRVNSDDLDLVITAVLIQRQVGGNLAEVLGNIASTIKERVRIKGEIKTLTAQGRASGWVIGLLPIAIGIIISVLNPDYLKTLFSDPLGQMMLAGSAIGQFFGVMIIRKIIDIEV